jgi:hypothetical protein
MLNRYSCARFIFATGSAGLLMSCATNTITLDRADTMVSAGREATGATSALMDRTRAANREILIEIVSLDPACNLPRPVIMSGNPPTGTRFCRPGGLNNKLHPNDWEMQRITARDLAATLASIRGLAGYLDLIDGVVSRAPLDLGADLAAVHSDLQTIKAAANAVAGKDLGIPDLSDEQKNAITGVFDLISVLIDEKKRVDDLSRIETVEQRQLFDDSVRHLRAANRKWTDNLQTQVSQRRTLFEDRLERLHSAGEAKRRPVVEALLETIEQEEKMGQLRASLDDVTDKLVGAHLAYLTLLDDPGSELTTAEKQKAAKINHDRIMGALKSLTAVLKAF